MYYLQAVRSSPQEKTQNPLREIEDQLRGLRYQPTPASDSSGLRRTLSAVAECAGRHRKAYFAFRAGADPASRHPGPAQGARSTLQRCLALIEDLATKVGGDSPAAEGARVRLIELDGDVRFARTLAAQGRLARTQSWPRLILNRLSEAAKLVRGARAEPVKSDQPPGPCI